MSVATGIADIIAAADLTLDRLEAFIASKSVANVPALIDQSITASLPAFQAQVADAINLPALIAAEFMAQQPTQLASVPSAAPPADQVLFVSNVGNDNAAGTQVAPLLTIERAIDLTPAGGATEIRLLTNIHIAAPRFLEAFGLSPNIMIDNNRRIIITSDQPSPRAQISWQTYIVQPSTIYSGQRDAIRQFALSGASSLVLHNVAILQPNFAQFNRNVQRSAPIAIMPSVRECGAPLFAASNCQFTKVSGISFGWLISTDPRVDAELYPSGRPAIIHLMNNTGIPAGQVWAGWGVSATSIPEQAWLRSNIAAL
jgi:hypothetical protein